MSEDDLKLLLRALRFSAERHRDQRRKDAAGTPYINHPISLVDILVNEADVTDVQVLCAALLHDVIEDTPTTASALEDAFGTEICAIVREVTDDKSLPKRERKLRQIKHASSLSDRAKLVKLADKISNLRDAARQPPLGWDLQRRQAYFEWANDVAQGLRGSHTILEALFDEAYALKPRHDD